MKKRPNLRNLFKGFGKTPIFLECKRLVMLFSFLDNIDRISEHNFTPNDDDLLRVRIPTTGIAQEDFQFAHVRLR